MIALKHTERKKVKKSLSPWPWIHSWNLKILLPTCEDYNVTWKKKTDRLTIMDVGFSSREESNNPFPLFPLFLPLVCFLKWSKRWSVPVNITSPFYPYIKQKTIHIYIVSLSICIYTLSLSKYARGNSGRVERERGEILTAKTHDRPDSSYICTIYSSYTLPHVLSEIANDSSTRDIFNLSLHCRDMG